MSPSDGQKTGQKTGQNSGVRRGRLTKLARSLEVSLAFLRGEKKLGAGEDRLGHAFAAIEDYERLSGEVYRLRAQAGTKPAELVEAEELLSEIATDLLRIARRSQVHVSAYASFISVYRSVWRKHFGLFLFTASFFIAMCLLGWNIGVNEPDYVTLIAGQPIMEQIYDHTAWFEKIQANPYIEGASIAWNNISVCLLGFALGAILGFGGLVILGFNGLLIGCLFGFCRAHGFDEALLGFVVSHGPLELTIIVASSFTGVLIGRCFYSRPVSKMRARLALAAKEAATLTVGIVPWLVVAACFEGFVSPFPYFTFGQKALAGLLIAACFWLWTFAPLPKSALKPDAGNAFRPAAKP